MQKHPSDMAFYDNQIDTRNHTLFEEYKTGFIVWRSPLAEAIWNAEWSVSNEIRDTIYSKIEIGSKKDKKKLWKMSTPWGDVKYYLRKDFAQEMETLLFKLTVLK